MAGIRHDSKIRKAVIKLGLAGISYSKIQERYPIPKSTISVWLKNAGKKPDRTRQLEHLKRIRVLAAKAKSEIHKEWLDRAITSGKQIAPHIHTKNTAISKALLAMLYWAEGSKYDKVDGLRFVNTDPQLLRLYMALLRTSYPIDETRLRARIHLHSYHSHKEALFFWSETLSIPSSQFGKIYVKKRSTSKKFRKNFQGICFVKYPDSFAREELLALGRALVK